MNIIQPMAKVGLPVIPGPFNYPGDWSLYAPIIHPSSTPSFPVDHSHVPFYSDAIPTIPVNQNNGVSAPGIIVDEGTIQTVLNNTTSPATANNNAKDSDFIAGFINKIKASPGIALGVAGVLIYLATKGGK